MLLIQIIVMVFVGQKAYYVHYFHKNVAKLNLLDLSNSYTKFEKSRITIIYYNVLISSANENTKCEIPHRKHTESNGNTMS